MFNLALLEQLVNVETTAGKEDNLLFWLQHYFKQAHVTLQPVGTRHNFLVTWGVPKILFCTHLDTVAPYFPFKVVQKGVFTGRGTCDAKGQIVAQILACEALLKQGYYNFGWLGVVGEESSSDGAKAANTQLSATKLIIVGEPTDNHLITATKGTFLVDFTFTGYASHSGYPKVDAIERYLTWAERLKQVKFPIDAILGETTYIFSHLSTNNLMNVVADRCSGQLFFRTTFATHQLLATLLPAKYSVADRLEGHAMTAPLKLKTFAGLPSKVAAFTSDAAYFTKVPNKILFGPGSILDAHTLTEKITEEELRLGVDRLVKLFAIAQQEKLC